jgi:hypothetical protein
MRHRRHAVSWVRLTSPSLESMVRLTSPSLESVSRHSTAAAPWLPYLELLW